MYRIGPAAMVLTVLFSGCADAERLGVLDLYRRAEALAHSLFGAPAADEDVIKPPANVDPRMALAPPAGGRMRLIEPSRPFRQQ